jgi:hypothetical protein
MNLSTTSRFVAFLAASILAVSTSVSADRRHNMESLGMFQELVRTDYFAERALIMTFAISTAFG